jgi:pimeloyl-ACP methyl ester carboxylesterase
MALSDFSIDQTPVVAFIGLVAVGSLVASIGWKTRPAEPGTPDAASGAEAGSGTEARFDADADTPVSDHRDAARGRESGTVAGSVATQTVTDGDGAGGARPATGLRAWLQPMLPPAAAWRLQLFVGVPVTVVLVGIIALVVDGAALIPDQFPNSYYLSFGLLVLAVLMFLLGWPALPTWQRVVSALSVPLMGLLFVALINQEYSYYPTISALFGKEAQHPATLAVLAQAQAEYKRTGQLPTHGFTLTLPIPGTESHFVARPATIWIPPIWVKTPTPKLPVLELLQGTPGAPDDWTRAGYADVTARTFAEAHGGVAPILVMADPNGGLLTDTECVNSTKFGNVETYLTTDVLKFVATTFSARSTPGSAAIGGFSEGGMCALMLAIRHPDVFLTFVDIAGLEGPTVGEVISPGPTTTQLFDGYVAAYNAHDPVQLLKANKYPKMSGWFEAALSDPGPLQAQTTLVPLATAAGIAVCAKSIPGQHDYPFAGQALRDSFEWVVAHLGLTTAPVSSPACPS